MLHVEILHCRLQPFAIIMSEDFGGVKTELIALCLMALLNRMDLDQLTAQSGGVCVLLNFHSC